MSPVKSMVPGEMLTLGVYVATFGLHLALILAAKMKVLFRSFT